jgi:hypothetical protein
MNATEMVKGDDSTDAKFYALVISTAPRDEAEFLSEWRHIGAALIQWTKRRGASAKTLTLSVVSNTANHARFRQIIQQIYEKEMNLSPLLKSLQCNIALLTPAGQPAEEYILI